MCEQLQVLHIIQIYDYYYVLNILFYFRHMDAYVTNTVFEKNDVHA